MYNFINYVTFDYKVEDDSADYLSDFLSEQDCETGRLKLIDVKVININFDKIFEIYLRTCQPEMKSNNSSSRNKIFQYCADRIIRYNGIYNFELWKTEIHNCYYGEEILAAYFLNHNAIIADLKILAGLKNKNERIEFALMKEYGYLLDGIKHMNWSVKKIPYFSITVHNKEKFQKLNPDTIKAYKEYNLPRCIVIPNNPGEKKYRLIDGYHRYASTTDRKISVIVGNPLAVDCLPFMI